MPIDASERWLMRASSSRAAGVRGVVLGEPRDLGRLVADALEVGHDLAGGEDQAQVRGRGLAAHDDLPQLVVDDLLELVHLGVPGDHLQRALHVAVDVTQDGRADVRFHEPAHLEHPRADRLQVLVVLACWCARSRRFVHEFQLFTGFVTVE
jgi:hypothetical protein